MWDTFFEQASQLRATGEPFVLATVVACQRPTAAYPWQSQYRSPGCRCDAGRGSGGPRVWDDRSGRWSEIYVCVCWANLCLLWGELQGAF